MFIVYDLIFLVITFIYLPKYLFRRKFHSGFLMRFSVLPLDLELNSPIWIHAVSVGEMMAARKLLEELRNILPGKGIVISTVTSTGNKIAKSVARETDFVTYLPLDLSFIVKRFVDKIKPSLLIIAETEIWPNLISYLYKSGTPVILINGRLSDRSFKGYAAIKFLLKPVLNKISLFCVQTENDKERFSRLGVPGGKIQVTGNMKFDIAGLQDSESDYADYRLKLGLGTQKKLWVCGSTHQGEEEIILDVYKRLLAEFPELKLLIAPRHPERAASVGEIVSGLGFRPVFISGLPSKPCNCIARPVFILDVIGELVYFYGIASLVFVGGSLIKKGGHNILEPASLGKPVITGPHMFNFRDISESFIENRACFLAHDAQGLYAAVKNLLDNPEEINRVTQHAREVILRNQGATRRSLECITGILSVK